MTCRVLFVTSVTIFVLLYSLSCLILENLKGAPDTNHVIFRKKKFLALHYYQPILWESGKVAWDLKLWTLDLRHEAWDLKLWIFRESFLRRDGGANPRPLGCSRSSAIVVRRRRHSTGSGARTARRRVTGETLHGGSDAVVRFVVAFSV